MSNRNIRVGTADQSSAALVLERARETSTSFFEAFETVRKARGAGQGSPTDEEQDLLRAAVVFAGAGLDSCLKHLIRDSMRSLIDRDEAVHGELEKFTQRTIRGTADAAEVNTRTLASLLVSKTPREDIIDLYIESLTGSSLQSAAQVRAVLNALGVDPKDVNFNVDSIGPIFLARNKIIHEMDIDLSGGVGRRKRQSRTKPAMQKYVDQLLGLGEAIVKTVENRVRE